MFRPTKLFLSALLVLTCTVSAQAGVVFKFTETGGSVKMTSSGSLDTSLLTFTSAGAFWGGVGTESNGTPGDIDIMGDTTSGAIDISFEFSPGTDASAITSPAGPFASSSFFVPTISGTKSFATYSGFEAGFRKPGISLVRSDIVGGIWTPDKTWDYAPGETFLSLGMLTGTYTVADAVTGEFITIQIGDSVVPEPASLALWSIGCLGGCLIRRRRS